MLGVVSGLLAVLTNLAILSSFSETNRAPARLRASWRAFAADASGPLPRRLGASWDALRADPENLRRRLDRVRRWCGTQAAAPVALGVGATAYVAQHQAQCVAFISAEAGANLADRALARRAAKELVPSAGVRVRVADARATHLARQRASRSGVPITDVFYPLYRGRGRRLVLVGPADRSRLRRALAGEPPNKR